MSIVKLSNNGVKNATSFGSASSGSMAFIKKLTASSSATLIAIIYDTPYILIVPLSMLPLSNLN